MIVIGGDALVDLIDRGQGLFEACPGGSTLNCALAAGQLGSEVLFVSTLSTDSYGDMLANRLAECNIQIRSDARSDAHTSLAVVSFDETNQPHYAFYRERTADREIPINEIIASFPKSMSIFHVGSCALICREDQDAWLQVVRAAKERGALISIDPNCRPSMTNDPVTYRQGLERFFEEADVIKCSDEDLNYLYPDWTVNEANFFAEKYAPQLFVYTRGAAGLRGFTNLGVSVEVEATLPGLLVDVVGAGDSVHGALLSEIDRLGLMGQQLAHLDVSRLNGILTLASRVAGVNCTRVGCQPPTRQEVSEFFG
jgi:fructokinase